MSEAAAKALAWAKSRENITAAVDRAHQERAEVDEVLEEMPALLEAAILLDPYGKERAQETIILHTRLSRLRDYASSMTEDQEKACQALMNVLLVELFGIPSDHLIRE